MSARCDEPVNLHAGQSQIEHDKSYSYGCMMGVIFSVVCTHISRTTTLSPVCVILALPCAGVNKPELSVN